MNKTRFIFLLTTISMVVFSSGCMIPTEIGWTPIHRISVTQVIDKSSPTATYTPTPSLLLTTTTQITSTVSLIPTLIIDAARIKLIDILLNNGSCRLPCLWGITPDKSSYPEAVNVLLQFNSLSTYSELFPRPGVIFLEYNENNLLINIHVRIFSYPENDIIKHISFKARAYKETSDPVCQNCIYPAPVFDSDLFGEYFSLYMLNHILSEYGKPSSVMLLTNSGPSSRGVLGYFNILLIYPDEGIFVNYSTIMRMSGSTVIGCLSNSHIEFVLFPSGNGDSFYNLLPESWKAILPGYQPIEDVTSFSIEKFYQTYRYSTDQCLETPSNLWPTNGPGGG